MTLAAGTKLGTFEVLSPLGAGGMGEVYRAHDPRLRRDVAIKVLPLAFTQDRERLARFEREAQLLAQLHHPHIASIFGLEESDGVRALVMELVEGPTLAERLAGGALPLEESLAIALQVAEALEDAHEKGIVHRDLKPQNIKAPREGKVKVLDFGLAKAMDPTVGASTSSGSQLSMSPTITRGATEIGTILGTAAYMAPEQASGGSVDRRADIWSFGVVLYEMLTGRRLFEGETVSHVLAGVLKDTPDFSALPPGTPDRITDLLRHCLRKKPRERLQAIGDARMAIEEVLADPRLGESTAVAAVPAPAPLRAPRLVWALAAIGLAAALGLGALWLGARRSAPGARVLQASLMPPDEWAFGDTFALSPDGRRIVFEAYERKTGTRGVWLRALDRGESTRLAPADGGEMPFWSPDGAHIGFFAEGKLKRLSLQGGPAQTICDAPTPRGGTWGSDGRIIFTPSFRTGLSVVPAGGGVPKPLTALDASRREKSHRFPVFLPGGKAVLFLAQTAEWGAKNDESAIEALELASGKRTRLVTANSSPFFAPGRILFWRDGALLAQVFDAERLRLEGDPAPLASPVAFTQNEQALAGVSAEGTLVYRGGTRGTFSSLVWLDRTGLGIQALRDRELLTDFALSHDGKRMAYAVNGAGQGSEDLWIQDLVRGSTSRLTFEEGSETYPVWSRDDRYVYYSADRKNDGTVFRRAADGTGAAEEIGTTASGIWPLAASADGKWLVVGSVGAQSSQDIFRYDLATKEIAPLVATPFLDVDGALSPDDRLLAYASELSGRWEVYVQALDGGRGRWQISSEGGLRPRWRADGRELFFLARPDRIMSVEVEPGAAPRFSAPRELFRHQVESFDVTPDGQRIVGRRPADGDGSKPLTLVSNWPLLIAR